MYRKPKNPSRDPHNTAEPFAIIQFHERNAEGKPLIDLVAKNLFVKKKGQWLCKYPDVDDYPRFRHYLERSLPPEESWDSYPFTFLVGAVDLEQGDRRLMRAESSLNCEPTDLDEDRSTSQEPEDLTQSELQEILRTKIPMHKAGPSTSAGVRAKTRFSRIKQVFSDSEEDKDKTPPKAPLRPKKKSKQIPTPSKNPTYSTIISGLESPKTGTIPKEKSSEELVVDLSDESGDLVDPATFPADIFSKEKSVIESTLKRRRLEDTLNSGSSSPLKYPECRRSVSDNELETNGEKIASAMRQQAHDNALSRKRKLESPDRPRPHLPEDCQRFMKSCLAEMDRKLENMREKIAYDVNKNMKDLKKSIIGNNLVPAGGPSFIALLSRLSVNVPMATLEEFLNYEEILMTDEDQVQSVRDYLRALINTTTNITLCVSTIMSAMLKRAVEVLYSGYGKAIKGIKKKKFSATKFFEILADVVIEKLGPPVDKKKVGTAVSTWLSRAPDREGGRKDRQSEARRRSRSAE